MSAAARSRSAAMTPPAPRVDRSPAPMPPLAWVGLLILLAATAARVMAGFNPLPYWDLDPFTIAAPMTGYGPAGAMVIDVIALLAASLVFLASARRDSSLRHVPVPIAALAVLGAAAATAHGWLIDGGSLSNQHIGLSWTAAVFAALAVWSAAHNSDARRLVLAVTLGIAAAIVVRGVSQFTIEHAQTVADFERSRETFFRARGWSAESSMARAFERRLRQPEATGWFGLSNVFASFMAAACAAWLALALGAGWKRTPAALTGSLCGLAASVAGLALAGSKGGYAAAALAVLALAAAQLARRRPRLSALIAFIGPALIAIPIAAIALRGLLGERIGELSILFRWFYLQAAARIFAAHPMLGVGPADFQQAYLLAKNPLSPEEVASPHNAPAEWLATLGVAGLAFVALLVFFAARTARTAAAPCAVEPAAPVHPEREQLLLRLALLAGAAGVLAGAWLDRRFTTPEVAISRVIGLALFAAAAWGVLALTGSRPRAAALALAGGAAALIIHAQIEVTATWPASAGLFWIVIAAAASTPAAPTDPGALAPAPSSRRLGSWTAATVAVTLGAAAIPLSIIPAIRWTTLLADAAGPPQLVARARATAAAASANPADPTLAVALGDAAQTIGAVLGRSVPANPGAVTTAADLAEQAVIPATVATLERAITLEPSAWQVAREAGRLCLLRASYLLADPAAVSAAAPDAPAEWIDRARRLATVEPPSGPVASQLGWLATTERAIWDLTGEPAAAARALAALERARALDPYNLTLELQRFDLAKATQNAELMAAAARRAIQLDELSRLDREARGLPPRRRAELETAAKSGS